MEGQSGLRLGERLCLPTELGLKVDLPTELAFGDKFANGTGLEYRFANGTELEDEFRDCTRDKKKGFPMELGFAGDLANENGLKDGFADRTGPWVGFLNKNWTLRGYKKVLLMRLGLKKNVLPMGLGFGPGLPTKLGLE